LIGRRERQRLQLGIDCLLLFAQNRHALTKLFQAQQFLLIGSQQLLDNIARPHLLIVQTLFALTQRISGLRLCQRLAHRKII
jgi:hypothetical protein